jgi:Domain of unknown function (DUF4383)
MPERDREGLGEAGGTAPMAQIAAMMVGAFFLLLGIAGFIPGITSDFDRLSWAGHHPGAQLLGVFSVSVLRNLVHVAFGIAGVVLARSGFAAQAYLFWGGIGYAALWLYGLAIDNHGPLNFVPIGTADNWLHLSLAVVMIGSGLILGRLGDPA